MKKTWLNYLNLSDHYERKARFLPAVLSLLPLLLMSAILEVPFLEWLKLLVSSVGIGAVVAVGLSHIASAMGNRIQEKMWPAWPHDSPTNRWLHPHTRKTSKQQRELWYAAIRRLVGIDIELANISGEEVETTINDAVVGLRHLFSGRPEAQRLRLHNVDYGFARNITGMRPIWIVFLLVSTIACWLTHFVTDKDVLIWAIVSTLLVFISVPLAFWILPGYVRIKSKYYAESFFGTLTAVDQACRVQ